MPNVDERDLLGTYRRCLFRNGIEATSTIGFDDAFQYEDFTKACSARRIEIEQFRPDLAETAYRAWEIRANKDTY